MHLENVIDIFVSKSKLGKLTLLEGMVVDPHDERMIMYSDVGILIWEVKKYNLVLVEYRSELELS